MIGMLDAWWTALFVISERQHAGAAINMSAEIVADPAQIPPDKPLIRRSRVDVFHEGYALEFRELWAGPMLVAAGQQTLVTLD